VAYWKHEYLPIFFFSLDLSKQVDNTSRRQLGTIGMQSFAHKELFSKVSQQSFLVLRH